MFESLETRRLLAFTASMNGSGSLSIHGGNTDNNLTIIENLGHVQITDNTDFLGDLRRARNAVRAPAQ